jgi:hypothetical protein
MLAPGAPPVTERSAPYALMSGSRRLAITPFDRISDRFCDPPVEGLSHEAGGRLRRALTQGKTLASVAKEF